MATSTGADPMVVEIDIERYLAGVLGGEMPLDWPAAALEAQAVAARTYAYEHVLSPEPGAMWDVTSDERSQVWRPEAEADPRARAAVEATRGAVLTWDGAVFPAYFHSTCGGNTVPPSIGLERGADIPPLAGVRCEACAGSPHYRWSGVDIPAKEVAAAAAAVGVQVRSRIDEVALPGSGTARQRDLLMGGVLVPAARFRIALGARRLRSTACHGIRVGKAIRFEGLGWGHGVGMCQWGARGRAAAGASWEEILAAYYPGARIERPW